jgi:hypothetical protein
MSKPKQSRSIEHWVVLELGINTPARKWPIVWGPFESQELANDFCNRRIMTLAGEWFSEESILTDCITWTVKKVSSVE